MKFLKSAAIIGLASFGVGMLFASAGLIYSDGFIEGKRRYEVTDVNSCEIDRDNYVVLSRKEGEDIYVRRIDGSYVRLDERFAAQKQELQKSLESEHSNIDWKLIKFDNEKKGLIKRIEQESGSRLKMEAEGRK